MRRFIKLIFGNRVFCNVYGHTYRLTASLGGSYSKTDCPVCGYVFHERHEPVFSYWTDEQGREWRRIA